MLQWASYRVWQLGGRARSAREKKETRKTTNSARERGETDRRRSGLQTAGCDRLREDASGGDGRYSDRAEWRRIRAWMAHLRRMQWSGVGAAGEPSD